MGRYKGLRSRLESFSYTNRTAPRRGGRISGRARRPLAWLSLVVPADHGSSFTDDPDYGEDFAKATERDQSKEWGLKIKNKIPKCVLYMIIPSSSSDSRAGLSLSASVIAPV
jgi:hypothetical protein